MKKFAIFLGIIIFIVIQIWIMYLGYQNEQITVKNENKYYENYYNTETNGLGVATLINKAMDSNNSNNIDKSPKGKYIENDTNSINVEIKMLDNDKTYNMETIFNGTVDIFASYYRDIKFKCTKIDYHEKTGRIKYMLFEQITQ